LIEALENDADKNIRLRAVHALEDFGDARIVEPLIEAANNDPSKEVRTRAFSALREFDDDRARDALIEFLEREYGSKKKRRRN
jgi:HEAT repeat protein